MTYVFTLPASFQPLDLLPPRLHARADDARWLVSTIVRKTAHKDVDPWGCVRLHSDVLHRVMFRNTVSAVVEAIEAGGAIETAPYCPHVKCKVTAWRSGTSAITACGYLPSITGSWSGSSVSGSDNSSKTRAPRGSQFTTSSTRSSGM